MGWVDKSALEGRDEAEERRAARTRSIERTDDARGCLSRIQVVLEMC